MPSTLPRHPAAGLLVLVGLLSAASPVRPQACNTPLVPPIDNRDGYQVLLEEAPVHPMELLADRQELWVANIPDGRVSVFSVAVPAGPRLLTEIPVGLGPVTIRRRPAGDVPVEPFPLARSLGAAFDAEAEPQPHPADGDEVWVVCQSSNSIFIVHPGTRRVLDTIRVPHEPAGLVFDEEGSRAYVTLSASNQVAEIDAATRQVLAVVEHESPVPSSSADPVHVEEPRALVLHEGQLLTLSSLSGNGTTNALQFGIGNLIADMWPFWPGTLEPPDRDVLAFPVPNPASPGTAVGWRLGTLNQDLKVLEDGRLLVSNVDLRNSQFLGEPIVQANRFVDHRLSLLFPTGGTPNPPPAVIDLNLDVDPTLLDATAAYSCAMPNEMALSSDQRYVWVACYETANTVVVDLQAGANGQVVMELTANGNQGVAPRFGPRGVVLREDAEVVYVYNRGDNTLQTFGSAVAVGGSVGPLSTVSIGFDVSPPGVIAGRRHLTNAKNSAFGTASCNTCHPDGHADQVAWDLGDFTGDLPTNPFPRDAKQLKVTQSLRGIEETPPFHWRGDRTDLAAFNPAFAGLLGGQQLSAAQVDELETFVFRLSHPPNWRQAIDRQYTQAAQIGFNCYSTKNSDTTATNTVGGTISAPCIRCHGMDGASGTSNQVVNDGLADDPTQLRGMSDKTSDTALVAGFALPAGGWGFANTGQFDTTFEFVDTFFPALTATEKGQVDQFLIEFDSGLAPTTHYAWTLRQANAGTFPPDPFLLINGANNGDNDLIVRGWIDVGAGPQRIGMLFNPRTQQFDTDTPGVGPFTPLQLDNLAAAGNGVFTWIGTPVLSGFRLALDREMDFLLDGRERALGTSLTTADSDGDGFPDGYEVRLGSNPLLAGSVPAPEFVAPQFTSLAISWNNSNVAKVRWSTDEESMSRVRVFQGGTLVWSDEDRVFKRGHVMVARGMVPAQSYRIEVETEDPAGNMAVASIPLTQQAHLFQSSHLQVTTLTQLGINGNGTVNYRVDFTVVDETGSLLANPTVTFDVVEWTPGAGNVTQIGLATTGSSGPGNANRVFTSQLTQGSGGTLEVVGRSVADPSNRLHFHPLDGQFGFWAQVMLP